MLSGVSPVPPGLIETIEAAGHRVSRAPEGWTTSNDSAVATIIAQYLISSTRTEFLRNVRRSELEGQFSLRIDSGLSYNGKLFQIDPASTANINAMATFALTGDPWPTGFYWLATDNSHVLMSAGDMLAFGRAAALYVSALILRRRTLKDALEAAASPEAVLAVDVTTGWP